MLLRRYSNSFLQGHITSHRTRRWLDRSHLRRREKPYRQTSLSRSKRQMESARRDCCRAVRLACIYRHHFLIDLADCPTHRRCISFFPSSTTTERHEVYFPIQEIEHLLLCVERCRSRLVGFRDCWWGDKKLGKSGPGKVLDCSKLFGDMQDKRTDEWTTEEMQEIMLNGDSARSYLQLARLTKERSRGWKGKAS